MDNKVFEKLSKGLESLPFVDVKNVVGEPFEVCADVKVFPFVKISVGMVGGGGECFGKKKKQNPFFGASTSGVSLEPLGFLIVRKSGQQIITLDSHNTLSKVTQSMADAFGYFLKKSGKAKLKKEKEKTKNAKKQP